MKAEKIERVTLSGVVKDQKGETLPGVTVMIKGTTLGGTTDIDGEICLDGTPLERYGSLFFLLSAWRHRRLLIGDRVR